MDNGKINAQQFKLLIIVVFLGTSVLNAPSVLAGEAKQNGWISSILSDAGALILVWFYNALGEQIGSVTLVEYTKKLFGKWIGGLISFTFVLFLFLNSSALVWIVANFMATQLMPETPTMVIGAAFMIVIVIGTKFGLEIIARSVEILYPWAMGGLILLLLFILPEAKIENLQPVFEGGIKPIIRGAVLFMSFTPLTFVAILMVFPSSINKIEEGKKVFFKGILTAGILITFLTIVSIMVLGVEGVERNMYPSYVLAKKISIGNFVERIEAVLGMVWIVTVFFKTVIYFYSTTVGFAQALGLKDYKPFVLPLGILVVLFSQIVYPDVVYASNWDSTTWVSYVLTYGFIYPLFLFIVGRFRRK